MGHMQHRSLLYRVVVFGWCKKYYASIRYVEHYLMGTNVLSPSDWTLLSGSVLWALPNVPEISGGAFTNTALCFRHYEVLVWINLLNSEDRNFAFI